ncbi:uncharacterized protein LOC134422755 [Melospiza melodia melodia]|uniref:uncharacterized protein LOC134422755 n=1 Tax=Melospiza melodia melodia TaxID=1914991 RepID=UPI002FD5CCB5
MSIKSCPCPAVATRTPGILAVPSSALVLLASSSSPPAGPMSGIMEPPAMLEDESAPENRRSKYLKVAFHALIFVLIIISTLVPIGFCLLYQQAPGACWAHGHLNESSSQDRTVLIWEWKLQHCKGIVQGQGEYLIIQESGRYFIYAQLFRKEPHKAPFSVMLYENKTSTPLNNAVGAVNGTVHFARPFLLKKGDKLYCKKNKEDYHNLLETQTYWGLFKM